MRWEPREQSPIMPPSTMAPDVEPCFEGSLSDSMIRYEASRRPPCQGPSPAQFTVEPHW